MVPCLRDQTLRITEESSANGLHEPAVNMYLLAVIIHWITK